MGGGEKMARKERRRLTFFLMYASASARGRPFLSFPSPTSASDILLKASFPSCARRSSMGTLQLSSVMLRTLLTCTPRLLWIPLHSMHMRTPQFMLTQSGPSFPQSTHVLFADRISDTAATSGMPSDVTPAGNVEPPVLLARGPSPSMYSWAMPLTSRLSVCSRIAPIHSWYSVSDSALHVYVRFCGETISNVCRKSLRGEGGGRGG